MTGHEADIIQAFIVPPRRSRWLESLASTKRRSSFLDRLNHCQDFDDRYATPLASSADVVGLLKTRGAAKTCYILSADSAIDGQEMPLAEAVVAAQMSGWGTIISCIPGQLAFYYDECGERQMLLERSST